MKIFTRIFCHLGTAPGRPCSLELTYPSGGPSLRIPGPPPFTWTISIYGYNIANMTLQDFFPFDSADLGLKSLYSKVGKDSFYVNSNCVVAKDKILTKGKHYIIFDIPTKTDIKMNEIVLIDLFYYKGYIHLISQDINTNRVFQCQLLLKRSRN